MCRLQFILVYTFLAYFCFFTFSVVIVNFLNEYGSRFLCTLEFLRENSSFSFLSFSQLHHHHCLFVLLTLTAVKLSWSYLFFITGILVTLQLENYLHCLYSLSLLQGIFINFILITFTSENNLRSSSFLLLSQLKTIFILFILISLTIVKQPSSSLFLSLSKLKSKTASPVLLPSFLSLLVSWRCCHFNVTF